MAGQTFVIELNAGDRIQAYMYTFTGLQDKPGNHLTQFTGIVIDISLTLTFYILII